MIPSSSAGGIGSIPDWGTKVLYTAGSSQIFKNNVLKLYLKNSLNGKNSNSLEGCKRHLGKPSKALQGSQAQRPFCPPFLIGRTPASMTSPELQRADLDCF